jgi:hypothetical protein
MAKRQVFYSFHYDNDVFRVQQIRNMGVLEGNEPVSKNDWEKLKNTGDKAVEKWIDDNMKGTSCCVVLIGSETSARPWVIHEIVKAWNDGKGLLGIYIDDLKDPRTSQTPPYFGRCARGSNPFNNVTFSNGIKLSTIVPCHVPPQANAYSHIAENIDTWIENAIEIRKNN